MSSSEALQKSVLDYMLDFTWHFDHHMKPALLKKKELPRDCKFCQNAVVEAQVQ